MSNIFNFDILQKVIKYSTYLLVFLLPLQTRWIIQAGVFNGGYFEYGTISLYAVDILLIFILLCYGVSFIVERRFLSLSLRVLARPERSALGVKQLQVTRQGSGDCYIASASSSSFGIMSLEQKATFVWFLIAIIELFIFLSCFRAPDKIIAFYTYGRFLMGVGLFYIVINPLCPFRPSPTPRALLSGRPKGAKYVGKATCCNFAPFGGDGAKRQRGSLEKAKTAVFKGPEELIYIFLAGTFLQSLLALYQVITQSTFANKFLGLAAHLPETLGTSVVELADGARWLRAYGGLDHPNMLGGLMAFAIMLVVIELITAPFVTVVTSPPVGENFRKLPVNLDFSPIWAPRRKYSWGRRCPEDRGGSLNKSKFIFLSISLTISTITLFFTFSRSAWLAAVAGIVALLFFSVVKKNLKMQKAILQVILLIASISFILFVFFNDLVATRISANTRLEQKSSIERLDSNREAIEIIKDNWLLGVGIGNYTQYLQEQNSASEAFVYQPVHNIILLVAAEIGVVALFIFIFLILYLLFNHVIYHVNSFLIIPLLILFLFDHWLWSLHFGVFLFWFILSLSYTVERPIFSITK